MARANPAPKKNMPSSSAPATIRHFTHAESANAASESTSIQTNEPRTMARAIQKLSHVHCQPERLACTKNKTSPGSQVIHDRVMSSTDIFPSTYSVRDNGRQRYKVRAP